MNNKYGVISTNIIVIPANCNKQIVMKKGRFGFFQPAD